MPRHDAPNPPRPPRTKAQLITVIARKLRERSNRRLTWTEFMTIMNAISVPQQEQMLRALSNGSNHALGTFILRELNQALQSNAVAEATTILADNSANLTELDKII